MSLASNFNKGYVYKRIKTGCRRIRLIQCSKVGQQTAGIYLLGSLHLPARVPGPGQLGAAMTSFGLSALPAGGQVHSFRGRESHSVPRIASGNGP